MIVKNEELNLKFLKSLFNVKNIKYDDFYGCISVEGYYNHDRKLSCGIFNQKKLSNLLYTYIYMHPNYNFYYTANSLKTNNRHQNNIGGLNAVYVDIDCCKQNIKKSSVLKAMPTVLATNLDSVVPTWTIDSGHGLHLIFQFDSQIVVNDYKVVSKWQYIEKYIATKIDLGLYKNFGKHLVDFGATDVTRLLRLPLSYNNKENRPIEQCQVINHHKVRYDMWELNDKFTPTPISYYSKSHKNIFKQSKPKIKVKIHKFLGTLNYQRCSDLVKLVKIRNGKVKGIREYLLFFYMLHARFIKGLSKHQLFKRIHQLNMSFNEPLSNKIISYLIKESGQKYILKYHYRNSKIIKILKITNHEQECLSTIISHQTKLKRKRTKVKAKRQKISEKSGAKFKRSKRNDKIISLHNAGATNTMIANEMNINRRTVYRVLKSK